MKKSKTKGIAKQQTSNLTYFDGYPDSLSDANKRYNMYGSKDCFPKIAPALLNSADIKAYVKQTGMICPFHEEDLQSASYKVRIAGKVIYWEYIDQKSQNNITSRAGNNTKKIELDLKKGEGFDLQPNSIAFVTLEPEFSIPEYIALRFNLKIKHIYKGLLLGTGPLVDPGFRGRLSIPLHNLTNNTYHFSYGETLITMEFTKLSPNVQWQEEYTEKVHNESLKFEKIDTGREVDTYIFNALKSDSLESPHLDYVISSIPDAIYDSQKIAEKAKKQIHKAKKDIENAKKTNNIITVAGIAGICTVVIASIAFAFSAFSDANSRYDKIRDDIHSQYSSEIENLQNRIDELNVHIKELEDQIVNKEQT